MQPRPDTISRANVLAGFLVVMSLVWAAPGCADQNWNNQAVSEKPADTSFQAGADRPPSARTLHAMSKILSAQGRDKQCRYVLMRIIHDYPDYSPAYCDLAELYMRSDDVARAVGTLEVGLSVSPRDAVLINDLGMCRLLQGRYQDAMERFTEAAGISPHDARYRANIAVAVGMMGRYEESLALFEQIVPEDQAHHNLAVVCEAIGDEERSKVEFEKADAIAAEALAAQQECR